MRRAGVTTFRGVAPCSGHGGVARRLHNWAISARGFNDLFANKLLVLMDGRSLYTPLFSGVYWDTQDTLLEDIDRVEVIRGPGATLWGANAVNGVINIITRSAKDTRGLLVTGGGGAGGAGFCRRALRRPARRKRLLPRLWQIFQPRQSGASRRKRLHDRWNWNAAGSVSTGTPRPKIITRYRAIFTPAGWIKPTFCPHRILRSRRQTKTI